MIEVRYVIKPEATVAKHRGEGHAPKAAHGKAPTWQRETIFTLLSHTVRRAIFHALFI